MNRSRLSAIIAGLCGLILGQAASAQTLNIIAGNGQGFCNGCITTFAQFPQTLVVKATDANGNPASGVTVNWSSSSSGLVVTSPTTTTGPDGTTLQALQMQLSAPVSFQTFNNYTVTAQAGNSSVTFNITQFFSSRNPNGGTIPAYTQRFDIPAYVVNGKVGEASSTSFQVHVQDGNGYPVPNIAVSLVPFVDDDHPASTAVAQCASSPAGAGPNIALTDVSGNATCTPVFISPGSGAFFKVITGTSPIGGDLTQPPNFLAASLPITFNIQAGASGNIKAVSSTSQTATPSSAVSFTAEVDSAANQPLSGQVVTWTVSPSTAGNLDNATTTTNSSGQVSNKLTLAAGASGGVQVVAKLQTDPSKSVTFNVTVGTPVQVTGMSIVSGNNQSAQIGSAFAQPLVVQVATSTGSAANVPVAFSVTSGSVTLSSQSVVTNASGQAQVTATAGNTAGPATVSASVSGLTAQTFNLTVLSKSLAITSDLFVNGADLQANSLSPCSIGAIQAPLGSLGATGFVPTFGGLPLSGNSSVSLTIGGIAAPVLSIGTNINNRSEIRFQVPCGVTPGGAVPATVTISGGKSDLTLNIQPASPGVFQTQNSDGVLRAVLVRPDGSFVSLENPARRGENEIVYVTGLGPTTPAVATPAASGGVAVPPPSTNAGQINPLTVQGTVIVGMAGLGLPLNYARLSDDIPGVYVVSFQIPSDMTTGSNVNFSVGVIPPGASTAIYSGVSKVPVQ